jgi:RNA polymerase sigma-70 factor (ECF subfamily)
VGKHTGDLELVERMLAGDDEAFTAFGDRYVPALYRFALGRLAGDRELTRDTVQTAMTKALSKLDTYRGEASLLTWLCACCRNEILMHHRSRRSRPAEVELDDRTEAAAELPSNRPQNPEAVLLSKERARLVHMALDLLAPRYAQALEWKYVERLSVQEIAARMEVGLKAADSLLTRARQAFKESYAGALAARAIEDPHHGRTRSVA